MKFSLHVHVKLDVVHQLLVVFQRASTGITKTVETSENVDVTVVFQPPTCNLLAHSASGPSLCSTLQERPHTISSGYSRTLSRPPVTARTFEPPYGFVKAKASTSVYATPTNVNRQTADIYARPTLCGRRFSQGALAVATPIVPSEYATCQKRRINTGASTGDKSGSGAEGEEMSQAHIHRSCSFPSPVYSGVCDFFCISSHLVICADFCLETLAVLRSKRQSS